MTIFWHPKLTAILIALGCASVTSAVFAGAHQPLDSITSAAAKASEQQAHEHGYDKVSVEIRSLDRRLRLPLCSKALTTFMPQASAILGAVSVGIRCTDTTPWTIYVRTLVTAQQSVPVLARSLPRNTLITKADLEMINQPVQSAANGVLYDPDEIIGKELTRPLDAGATIRLNHLRPPKVIKRGQQVTLVTGFDGLQVRIQGRATKDAAAGDRVEVINLDSGLSVEGVARPDGTVSVQ